VQDYESLDDGEELSAMTNATETPRDIARKGHSLALRRLAEKKATVVAREMDETDSSISKLKNEQLEQCILLLAHLGIRLVPADAKCLSEQAYQFLTSTHARFVRKAPQLVWCTEE
jgi:hypothetical protein